jgi:hypothetical protein
MTEAEFRALCLAFPGAEAGTSYGLPAFLVNRKFFTRLRAEDASVVIMEVGLDEREMLLEADPETFHITDHFRNYPAVLARLERLAPPELRGFLERRWRKIAPKALLKAGLPGSDQR